MNASIAGTIGLLSVLIGLTRPVDAGVDVLVYGGTPGGIAAALAAAGDGADVVLIEPTRHLGGLTTSGLSHTDFRSFEGLNGTFLAFAKRVEDHYRSTYGENSEQLVTCWRGTQAEPRVNELVFEAMLAESPTIRVLKDRTLVDVSTTTGPEGRQRITRVIVQGPEGVAPEEFRPRIVIDGSYEGDLMARAGVAYRVGREGRDETGESLAPERSDRQLQAYNFRLIMTQDPALRVPVERPEGYRREDFVEILPMLADGRIKKIFDYPTGCIYKAQLPPLPNGKHDINDVSRGLVRLSLPGANLGWPDGDAETRARIFADHLRHDVGMLYFLQTDPAVPDRFQAEALAWGWCRDEFVDNGHLPWQLYVREARRMEGVHLFHEGDTDQAPNHDPRSVFQPEAIAMGDYGPNCHGTDHEGPRIGGQHVGEFYKSVAPYQIPYGVLVPRDVDNLLVPVACSATHVGFCALRLEPVWMSLGQAAGVAARVALVDDAPVAAVDLARVQNLLHDEGAATIYVSDVPPGSPFFSAVQWLGARGGLHGLTATDARYGTRGPNIEGQYYEAYPGHAFEPGRRAEPALIARWTALLPEPLQDQARRALDALTTPTRGEVAALLFELSTSPPR